MRAPHIPGFVFQIILVSSSLGDRDDSLFLSTDEGTTFQKQLIPFSVETLIFHPREEDKLLAYSKEGKVSGLVGGRRPGTDTGYRSGDTLHRGDSDALGWPAGAPGPGVLDPTIAYYLFIACILNTHLG